LQELTLFHYIQITGGNKYRGGYQYKVTNLGEDNGLNISIENALKTTLENIKSEYEQQRSGTVGQTQPTNSQLTENKKKTSRTTTK
jgi:hypothetical protein